MPFGPGDVVEGVVGKIMPYGAFVNLPDGKRGLIHISEIANTFVTDVSQYLKERQTVRVKVLQISPDGRKVDLSLRQLEAGSEDGPTSSRRGGARSHPSGTASWAGGGVEGGPVNVEELYRQIRAAHTKGTETAPQNEFEEKLMRFLKVSEEKLADVRKNLEAKRGGGKRGRY